MARDTITSMAYGRAVALTTWVFPSDDLRPILPHWWSDAGLAVADAEKEVEILAPEFAEEEIRELEHWVAEHAREVVFIHAGVVAVGDAAVLLPGTTHAGKSALTAALLRAGASYGSDEYAVLTPDGLVHAYPRRLTLRTPQGIQRVPATELGASPLGGPVRVAAVADVRYQAGSAWNVTELTRGQTAMRLIDNAVAAQSRPVEVLDTVLATLASLRIGVQGVRGEADEAAAAVLELLDGDVA